MAKDSIDKALFGIMYVYCYKVYSFPNNDVVGGVVAAAESTQYC